MYEVTVHTNISASHHLRGYRGKCENIHGHNWKIEATVGSMVIDATGLVVDFGLLRDRLKKITEPLDHSDLNSHEDFKDQNPSSENLARLVYQHLEKELLGEPVKVVRVRVWETEGSFATYYENS